MIAFGLAALFCMACGCNRVAEESASQAKAASTSVASATDAGPLANDRCVVPTPAAAPPAVPPGPALGCPVDPNPHTLQTVTVKFPDARAGAARVTAELARRPEDSERGLMYRTQMDEDRGMLFDLGVRQVHSFWMHNTCIPLDMLFIDDDGFIVGIAENVPTLNNAPRSVACPSTHVLEVNAGWSRRHGVRAGDRALLPGA